MSSRLYSGKWDGIWDKPKYQRIRDKIYKAFEGIEFVEETHQYFYKGKELIPTSNVCHLFRLPFDEDMMAEHCEKKYFDVEGHKYYHMTKDEIIEAWHANSKRSTDHGTLMHLFGENCAYFMMRRYDRLTDDFKARIVKDDDGREYVESKEPKEEAIVKFWNDLPVSIIPLVFEIQMFSLKYGISGTADLLFLHDPNIEDDNNDEEISQRLYLMDYKGLPLNTPILTINGWKTMGDIRENDIVFDRNGDRVFVLKTSTIHNNPCYKITFRDGDSIVADKYHRWVITYVNKNNGSEVKEEVLTTEDLRASLEYAPSIYPEACIKVTEALKGKANIKLDIDIETCPIEDFLKAGTDIFMLDMEQKEHILCRIMDEYGSCNMGYYVFKCKDERMSDFFVTLLSSMGIGSEYKKGTKNKHVLFSCWFKPYLKKRLLSVSPLKETIRYKAIKSVKQVNMVPTRCIEVSGNTHTYLCGSNLLVTHNTNADLYKSFGNMLEPFNEMLDCDLSGYKLQAAIYSKFLLDLGFGFIARALIWLKDNGDGTGDYEKVKMESMTDVLFSWLDEHPLRQILR